MARIEVARTDELSAVVLEDIRALMDAAFDGDFTDDDWSHSLGGWHVMAWDGDDVLSHASLVERRLFVDDRALRGGYVEAVGTAPAHQGRGLGRAVMGPIGQLILERFDLGALSTSAHGFYEGLGWERWQGPTSVRHPRRVVRTPDEDDGLMVLRTPACLDLDLTGSLACEKPVGGRLVAGVGDRVIVNNVVDR
ncbi:MAG: GNAT family N-acetyltransferase [Acidimicrobiales bacterium]